LEGPLSLVDCVADKRACDRVDRCPARGVWQELAGAVESVLHNVTLEDLTAPDGRSCSRIRKAGKGHRPPADNGSSKPRRTTSRTRRTKVGKK
jgi:DNA-binding IscR family transcriptional regulator